MGYIIHILYYSIVNLFFLYYKIYYLFIFFTMACNSL